MRTDLSHRLTLLIMLAASVACLGAAFLAAGFWAAACLLLPPAALMACHANINRGWAASVYLGAMTGAAAAAAIAGATALLVVPGAALSLATWDLAGFDRFLRSGRSPSTNQGRPPLAAAGPEGPPPAQARPASGKRAGETLVRRHAFHLAQALALGLLTAGGGFFLSLRIPFGLMLLLVILDLACLAYVLLRYRTGKGASGVPLTAMTGLNKKTHL